MDEIKEVLPEGTIPMAEPEVELQTPNVEEPAPAPQEAEKLTDDVSPDTEPTADDFTLQYNHEDVKVSKDEGKRLAQYGLFLEKLGKQHDSDIREVMADLDYYATIQGKTIKEIVKAMVDGVEESYRNELLEQFGEDNSLVSEMLELRRTKNRKAYEDAKAEREAKAKRAEEEADKSAAAKLAEQFEELRLTFPELDSTDKIPDEVLKKALMSGDLEKEMLRYERSERKKIEAEKASQNKNEKESIGSAQSPDAESGVVSAFMAGLRG